MYIDSKSGIKIYADLNCSVSVATHRPQDLLPCFLDIMKDTPEYTQFMKAIPGYVFKDNHAAWWDEDGADIVNELFDVLDAYAPEGYYFGAIEGDGADFGFWQLDDFNTNPDQSKETTYLLPAHWAAIIVNDDFSGVTDEEENKIRSFLKEAGGYVSGVDLENTRFSHSNDAGTLACECAVFTFRNENTKNQ